MAVQKARAQRACDGHRSRRENDATFTTPPAFSANSAWKRSRLVLSGRVEERRSHPSE